MAKKNKKENKISKKEIALAIYARLDAALADYQSVIGEKKFVNNLKKAAKGLAEEVAENSKKQKAKLEKEAKKAATKKNAKKKKAKPVRKPALKKNKTEKIPMAGSEAPETVIDQSAPPPSEQ